MNFKAAFYLFLMIYLLIFLLFYKRIALCEAFDVPLRIQMHSIDGFNTSNVDFKISLNWLRCKLHINRFQRDIQPLRGILQICILHRSWIRWKQGSFLLKLLVDLDVNLPNSKLDF